MFEKFINIYLIDLGKMGPFLKYNLATYRLNGNGACGVGLHVDSVLVWQRWQVWIVNDNLGSCTLGQLGQHVVFLIEE